MEIEWEIQDDEMECIVCMSTEIGIWVAKYADVVYCFLLCDAYCESLSIFILKLPSPHKRKLNDHKQLSQLSKARMQICSCFVVFTTKNLGTHDKNLMTWKGKPAKKRRREMVIIRNPNSKFCTSFLHFLELLFVCF